ncbi:hypothetical protein TNCV_1545461 [Trichonephila clavipes]|nr:hypothetical protein TNCV_1545461 [Trichonephila clavipes]
MKRKAFHPVPRIPTHSYIGYTEAMLKKIEDQNAQLNRIGHLSPHWSSAPEVTPPTTHQSLQHQNISEPDGGLKAAAAFWVPQLEKSPIVNYFSLLLLASSVDNDICQCFKFSFVNNVAKIKVISFK